MKKIGLSLITLLAANTLFAQTSPLSYDYVGGSLGTGDVFEEDYSFYGLIGSKSINESFFVKGSWFDGSTDDDINFGIGSSKVENSGYALGVGYHMPFSATADFVVSASYLSSELELFGFSEKDDGYGVDAGVRFKATERLELNAFAAYADVGEGDMGWAVSGYYFLTPTFSVGGSYEDDGDELETVSGTVRFHF
ncbi:MAG: outer membrane beta-barrel protein [Pseudomonadota bacterium]